jgi:predicted amidohydrolase YtcJ
VRLIFAFVLLVAVMGCGAEHQRVDLILRNGVLHTMNPAQPLAQALAISDGRIVAVGSDAEIGTKFRSNNDVDLKGKMVLPGFIDAHSHPIEGGVELGQCDLSEMATVDAIVAKVAACNAATPGSDWLIGARWNLALFANANPSKLLLDQITTDRPILLGGADGHSSWVNSKALELAGINAQTPNPANGIIERDPSTGEPSGTLRESAQRLVGAKVPPLSLETREAGLLRALAMANGFGITSIIDASVGAEELAAYEALAAQGKLTARIVASIAVTDPQADSLMRADDRGTAKLVHADAAKIFVDGVLEGETAALLEPYLDNPGHVGQLNETPEQLTARVVDLDKRGIQVHMHAIGDRASRVALDAVAAARAANGPADNRHHIAHIQLVDAADRPRFAQLGVIANAQALWAFPDAYITDINLPQVGQTRVDQMYPFGSLVRAGATLVGGSDWSVSSMNPLLAIETGVTRQDPTGQVSGVLNAAERLPLQKMLEAYTANGAFLMHEEKDIGSLEVGKFADIVVLDRNLFDVPPAQIGDAVVTLTLLAGNTVYER